MIDKISLLKHILSINESDGYVEFKENFDPERDGKNISAISNIALIKGKDFGYLVYGIQDKTKKIIGTKLMVDCCATGISEVICIAKSELYFHGNISGAISLSVWTILLACFLDTQKKIVFPISPEIGSLGAFSKNVLQNSLFVLSEKNFLSKLDHL